MKHPVDVAFDVGRKAEREQCCRDVCEHCREGSEWRTARLGKDGLWIHEWFDEVGERYTLRCLASPIRNRAREEGEG